MADRRQPFSFRLWPTRRTQSIQAPSSPPPSTQTPPPPPPTTISGPTSRPTPESRPPSRQPTTGTTSTAPPTAETQPPPPPPIARATPESQPSSRQSTTNPTATTPPTAETQTPGDQPITTTTKPPNPTSPPTPPPPPPTTTTITSPKDEPKNSTPSTPTKSPSSSKPASPSRRTTQSRSPPPQPSSPSLSSPQSRPVTYSSPSPTNSHNSKNPSTPQRASQPHSPSRLTPRSPKHTPSNSPKKETQPNSPSKESRPTAQEISTSYEAQIVANNQKDSKHGESQQEPEPKAEVKSVETSASSEDNSKPVASQEEPQLKAEVKSDGGKDINGDEETSFKHNEVKEMVSKSSEHGTTSTTAQTPEKPTPTKELDASTINGGQNLLAELQAKPEETKEVQEVLQATKSEANGVTKKKTDDVPSSNPGSGAQIIEKSDIVNKPDEIHAEKKEELDRKEILAASLPSIEPTTSQEKKRSTNPGTHIKSVRTNGADVPLNKDIRDDISTFVNKMAIGDPNNAIHDRKVSIITLAGENRGASMQMGSNSLKEVPVHIHRGYKIKPDESAEASTDGEGGFKGKQSENVKKATEDQPTEAYVNNNAQGINNSIVFNSSIAENNPGVHMVVTHAPKEPIQSTEKMSPLEARKAEFNMSRSEKLTYEPTVRRRCLRGLFLETSDSDPENPEKPRRHGCRVGCQQKDKENSIDVL